MPAESIHRYVSIHGGQWGEIAEYLTWNIPKKYRVAFTRFRMVAHALEVETGRHHGISYDHRFCKYCKGIGLECIEDGQHFLFECSLYDDIREQFESCYSGISRNLFSIFSS